MTALAMRVVAVHHVAPLERRGELLALIVSFLAEHPFAAGESEPPGVVRLLANGPARGSRADVARVLRHRWAITEIASVPALAQRRELSDGQLAWVADVRGLERTVDRERLRNYRYLAIARPGGLPRVIEAPKARLKEIQRWVWREILDHVPPHQAAHGFTVGRSAVTHARIHAGQGTILRFDLKDFFASVPAGRVYGIWRTLGYSRPSREVLSGLTTNTIPASVWQIVASATPERAVQARFWLGR